MLCTCCSRASEQQDVTRRRVEGTEEGDIEDEGGMEEEETATRDARD